MRMEQTVSAVVLGLALVAAPGWGQAAPASNSMGGSSGGAFLGGSMLSQEQFQKLSEYADQAKRLTKDDKAKGKTLEQVLAEDRDAAIAIAKAMPLSCTVTNAIRFAEGPETIGGKTVQTQTYEAACANGMGYFLISVDQGAPRGLTCFAVDATAKADIKAGRKPADVCRLPGNSDLKLTAATMLAGAGITGCKVKDTLFRGQSAASRIEFDEVACEDGQGYIMMPALPGSQAPIRVQSCNQAAQRGLACQLSDNGHVSNSPKALREALAKYKIACEATDDTTRLIGQQANVKRNVVEFACPQQPKGLVAFIPYDDSKAPFEAVSCSDAVKRGAICALPANKK